ncbi:MAG TPA: neutral zinc metallopeptidase [bacterium]
MRLGRSRRSENVEDRRGMGIPRGVQIGGAGGLGLILLVVVGMLLGVDPTAILQTGIGTSPSNPTDQALPRGSGPDSIRDFVSAVLGETEDVWTEVFRASGRAYVPPKLVLFSGAAESACGLAQSAMGPFYCPLDQKVYLDYSFFRDLDARFGASGDFAQAYVIAHEVGHHVQTLLGITDRVQRLRERSGQAAGNELSVRFELQADCLAGVWANRADSARKILEAGDVEEGLDAASAVGDDRIQRRTQGYVVPDAFTHGSSAQRVTWFRRGLDTGNPDVCETFSR